jgi:hypothetical protein
MSMSDDDDQYETFVPPPPPVVKAISSQLMEEDEIIPATPPTESEEMEDNSSKFFKLTELPGVIISKLCNYLELNQILDLKFAPNWPRCKHLHQYLTKKVRHNHISILQVSTLMHYRTPRPYSRYLMAEVKSVELGFFMDDIECSSFFSQFKLHTIHLKSCPMTLNYALPSLFDPKALRVLKISSSVVQLIVFALKSLAKNYSNVECLDIDQIYVNVSDVVDISTNAELVDDEGNTMIWPNLRTLKVNYKNFMQKQRSIKSMKVKFPKLEEIHEAETTWKLGANGQWQAVTEAIEFKIQISYKRKLLDLSTLSQTAIEKQCYICSRNSAMVYPFHGQQICLSCMMMHRPNYKVKEDIMELVQEKKKQKKCCNETICECVMLLDEKTIALL